MIYDIIFGFNSYIKNNIKERKSILMNMVSLSNKSDGIQQYARGCQMPRPTRGWDRRKTRLWPQADRDRRQGGQPWPLRRLPAHGRGGPRRCSRTSCCWSTGCGRHSRREPEDRVGCEADGGRGAPRWTQSRGLQSREPSNPTIWLQTGLTAIEFRCPATLMKPKMPPNERESGERRPSS